MHRAFDRASQQGALLFAAVGNDGADAPANYPAAFPEVIAITAVDAAQQLYNQANQNSGTDFAAPGVDIWVADPGSATLNNQGSYATGTSFATPMAMAVAANVVRKHPNIPKSLLLRVLHEASIDLGEPGEDSLYGAGLLQQICLNPKIQDKAIRTQR
jgi:subtilisin family serine protease